MVDEMSIKQELLDILDNLNEVLDDLAKIMRQKIKNDEMVEYKQLKAVYDKLKGTV